MNKSRQQFDRYFSDKHYLTMKHFGDPVIKFTMDRLFEVWQASRESLEIELPRKHDVDDEYDYFAMGYNLALNKIHDLLVEKGVKVK